MQWSANIHIVLGFYAILIFIGVNLNEVYEELAKEFRDKAMDYSKFFKKFVDKVCEKVGCNRELRFFVCSSYINMYAAPGIWPEKLEIFESTKRQESKRHD